MLQWKCAGRNLGLSSTEVQKNGDGIKAVFPLSFGGRIKIRDRATLSSEKIRDEISSTLLVEGIRADSRHDEGAVFRLGLLQYFSREDLMGVSSGRIRCFEKPKAMYVSYRLCFFPLILLVTAFTLLCREAGNRLSPIPIPREYYLLVWIWLVGGNILITLYEFRRFLRKCAAESRGRVYYWKKQGGGVDTP